MCPLTHSDCIVPRNPRDSRAVAGVSFSLGFENCASASVLYVGDDLLSLKRSTISAKKLNFRVRNGNGCTLLAEPPTYSTQAIYFDRNPTHLAHFIVASLVYSRRVVIYTLVVSLACALNCIQVRRILDIEYGNVVPISLEEVLQEKSVVVGVDGFEPPSFTCIAAPILPPTCRRQSHSLPRLQASELGFWTVLVVFRLANHRSTAPRNALPK